MSELKPETIIDLIRHGEPVGGRAYRGNSIDDPLSEKGWLQMWNAIETSAYTQSPLPWDQIISSPLQRCQSFAAALTKKHNIPYSIEENFKEVGFGSWEGRTADEIKSDNAEEFENFYIDPVNKRPAGAEPLDKFIERVNYSYDHVIKKYQGKHLLIVAHAGVNRAIIANALHSAPIGLYRIKVNNAGMTRLMNNRSGNHLLYHNVALSNMTSK